MIFFLNFFDKFSIYSDFSKKPGANAPGSQIAAPVSLNVFHLFMFKFAYIRCFTWVRRRILVRGAQQLEMLLEAASHMQGTGSGIFFLWGSVCGN
jgi:hypothetical protein